MTGGQIFLAVWCVVAVGLGVLFALSPERVVQAHRKNLDFYRVPTRWKERMELPPYMTTVYRAAGYFFIAVGWTVGLLAVLGVIRPD